MMKKMIMMMMMMMMMVLVSAHFAVTLPCNTLIALTGFVGICQGETFYTSS